MPGAFSWLLKLPPFRALYRAARSDNGRPFSSRALSALRIEILTSNPELARIPARGPVVVVANHPHGIADGLVVLETVRRVRSDVRVLTNYLVSSVPELRDECLFVDPFGGPLAAARSRAGLRAATRWLGSGHALVVFPAGEVAANLDATGRPIDGHWLPSAGKLAGRTGAPIVPVRIEGRNSRRFYWLGAVHPRLRTVLLPFELLGQSGSTIRVRIGDPLHPRARDEAASVIVAARSAVEKLASIVEPVVSPVSPGSIAVELGALPSRARLLTSGDYQVFCAPARSIPCTLREIGRLRETTFRGVGEGTGRSIDLDRFDRWYDHLFVWNAARREIAGAYRVGRADEIVAAHGVAGLYTNTLFQYDTRLLDRIWPALELGRSFVRQEYQRHSNVLLLLWRGIGTIVAREPKYRHLFGPVSISSRYEDSSQRMLMAFLEQNHRDPELGELVRAFNPIPGGPASSAAEGRAARNASEMNRLIAASERDGKGMPVLLRQYLRLNAVLLGFNRDPQFGDVLDALMMVDLARVAPEILARYVGTETAMAVRKAA